MTGHKLFCSQSVSSGKDVSQLFASVVKNVVSKNPEVSLVV